MSNNQVEDFHSRSIYESKKIMKIYIKKQTDRTLIWHMVLFRCMILCMKYGIIQIRIFFNITITARTRQPFKLKKIDKIKFFDYYEYFKLLKPDAIPLSIHLLYYRGQFREGECGWHMPCFFCNHMFFAITLKSQKLCYLKLN